jgi:DNA-binding NtrC family response regulator
MIKNKSSLKILLVDDEEEILQVIREFLADYGYESIIAKDGREALDILASGVKIGLVISDIRMPRLDGLGLLRHICDRFEAVPVVLITGHGDEPMARIALQEGAYRYMQKPVRLSELLACITAVDKAADNMSENGA